MGIGTFVFFLTFFFTCEMRSKVKIIKCVRKEVEVNPQIKGDLDEIVAHQSGNHGITFLSTW